MDQHTARLGVASSALEAAPPTNCANGRRKRTPGGHLDGGLVRTAGLWILG
jgi:hypothetical protein